MSTEKKVLGNAFAQFLGKALTVVASFVVVKIVAGFGTEFYGNYVTAYEFLAFFGILADAGLFAIAVRDISRSADQPTSRPINKAVNRQPSTVNSSQSHTAFVIGNILSMRLILITGTTLLAGLLAQLIPNYPPEVKLGIWITGLSMALTIVAGTLSSVLQARMKIQYFSLSLVLGKIILAASIFWISHSAELFEHIFFTFLWAGVLSNIIFCALTYFFTARETKISLQWNPEYLKKTIKTSLPYGAALVLQTLYLRVDLILISMLLGSAAIGIYGLSARILESFLILGVFFGQAILPKISAEEENHEAASQTLSWGMEKLLLFSLPIIWGSIIFAAPIVELLSSSEFLSETTMGSDGILKVLIVTVFFAFFNQIFSFALVAKNKQNFLLISSGSALILNVILNLIFLSTYGIIAAAASTVFCEILVFALLLWKVQQYFQFKFCIKNLINISALNLGLIGIIILTPLRENLILSLALSISVYGGFMWFFRKNLLSKS